MAYEGGERTRACGGTRGLRDLRFHVRGPAARTRHHPPRYVARRGDPFVVFADPAGSVDGVALLLCPDGDCTRARRIEGRASVGGGPWTLTVDPDEIEALGRFRYRIEETAGGARTRSEPVDVRVVNRLVALAAEPVPEVAAYASAVAITGATEKPASIDRVDPDDCRVFADPADEATAEVDPAADRGRGYRR